VRSRAELADCAPLRPDGALPLGVDQSKDERHGATSATGGGATCELTDGDPCAAGANRLGLILRISGVSLRVGGGNRILATIEPGSTLTRNVRLLMACTGSDGAGKTLTTQLVFTATA
jgi:hypothetical protein